MKYLSTAVLRKIVGERDPQQMRLDAVAHLIEAGDHEAVHGTEITEDQSAGASETFLDVPGEYAPVPIEDVHRPGGKSGILKEGKAAKKTYAHPRHEKVRQ